MDIELFMTHYPDGLSKGESLLLINGGATNTGAILFQRGGEYSIHEKHEFGVASSLSLQRIDGPQTHAQLKAALTEHSR